jgi:hypothetical protein
MRLRGAARVVLGDKLEPISPWARALAFVP